MQCKNLKKSWSMQWLYCSEFQTFYANASRFGFYKINEFGNKKLAIQTNSRLIWKRFFCTFLLLLDFLTITCVCLFQFEALFFCLGKAKIGSLNLSLFYLFEINYLLFVCFQEHTVLSALKVFLFQTLLSSSLIWGFFLNCACHFFLFFWPFFKPRDSWHFWKSTLSHSFHCLVIGNILAWLLFLFWWFHLRSCFCPFTFV